MIHLTNNQPIEDLIMTNPSNIYVVTNISEAYGNQPAYAVSHIYEGIVSVWDDKDFAYQVCEDLELGLI
jgi:hypothetical protein